MTRFTIKSSDNVKVIAINGRNLIATCYGSFSNISECIAWAKEIAEQKNARLTEVEIVNNTNDRWAIYAPNGKRL